MLEISLNPIYPRGSTNINVVYNDGDDSVVFFPKDDKTYVLSEYG